MATASTAKMRFAGKIQVAGRKRESTAQSSTVASDPQVPGPGRRRPAPKNVATSVAQSGADCLPGARSAAARPGIAASLVIGILWRGVGQELVLRVADGRRNHILPAGPL